MTVYRSLSYDGAGATRRAFTKPYRWEILSTDGSGFIHDAGEADTFEEARAARDAALPRYLRHGAQGAVIRVVNPEARSFEVVDTTPGTQP